MYIVYQLILISSAYNNTPGNVDQQLGTIVRKVEAINKHEAIGKFIEQTKSITAQQKYGIECIELKNLIAII